jgi:ubiquinone/menaquinone biosynthesis C-methylase UbiE
MNSDKINKEYWKNIEPEKILSGTVFPGRELTQRLKSGKKVLDIGCGAGKVSDYLFKKGYSVTGIDINIKALKEARKINKNINYKKADITSKIPFASGTFDAVVVPYVFTSIISKEEQKIGAKEIKRVLKKGGYLWLCDATYSPEYKERYQIAKKILGEDNVGFSYDKSNKIERVIRHYREEDFDTLFSDLSKIYLSKISFPSPHSGAMIRSLKIIYQK